jgi:hypothetical protein
MNKLSRVAFWLLFAAVVSISLYAGIPLRFWTFDTFDAAHCQGDTQRQIFWGLNGLGPEGILNQYDKMAIEPPDAQPFLDYSPLRLAAMYGWAACVKHRFPDIESVPRLRAYDYGVPPDSRGSYKPADLARTRKFYEPILWFNVFMDLIGAAAAFEVTRFWVKKTRVVSNFPQSLGSEYRSVALGLLAALFFWFNPNVLLDAYGWPTWDVWVVSTYLLTAAFASHEWWFATGVSLAAGLMLKGQLATVTPVFLLWPLVWRGFPAALRTAAGLVFGIGIIVSPWMLTYIEPDTLQHIRSVQQSLPIASWPPTLMAVPRVLDWPALLYLTGIVLVVLLATQTARLGAWRRSAPLIVFAVAIWPWLLLANRGDFVLGIGLGMLLTAVAYLISARKCDRLIALGGTLGIALLLCMRIFHASAAWYHCGFQFPQLQSPYLIWGPASNLPAIFELRFGWPPAISTHAFTLPALFSLRWLHHWPAESLEVSIGAAFDSVYIVLLLLSSVAIGLHARLNSRAILPALVTPWFLFFLLLVRLHERYLLFAAGASAICVGYNVGMTLLGCCATLASMVMTLMQMGGMPAFGQNLSREFPAVFSPQSGETIRRIVQGTHPDIGWGVLMIGAVFFYLTMASLFKEYAIRRSIRPARVLKKDSATRTTESALAMVS